jgi:hypothetical protein
VKQCIRDELTVCRWEEAKIEGNWNRLDKKKETIVGI